MIETFVLRDRNPCLHGSKKNQIKNASMVSVWQTVDALMYG